MKNFILTLSFLIVIKCVAYSCFENFNKINAEIIETKDGIATIEYEVNNDFYRCDIYESELNINAKNTHKLNFNKITCGDKIIVYYNNGTPVTKEDDIFINIIKNY